MTTLKQRFKRFDRKNPRVFHLFRRFAFEAKENGFKHYGAKAIMEQVRWRVHMTTGGDFKINNSYTSFYARKFMDEYPTMDGFFRTRLQKRAA